MAATDPVTPEPRRFTIRLPRPLWIGLAALGLVLVAVGLQTGVPIYRQRVAIREIRQLEALVATRERGPDWLRRQIGDEWMEVFDEAEDVESFKARFTDGDMAHLSELTSLKSVSIGQSTEVTDRGLMYLKGHARLEYLYLHSPFVTDAGLVHLKGLRNLKFLLLGRTKITESGIAELQRALPAVQVDVRR